MVHSFYRREVERAQIRGIPYPAFMDTCVSAASKLGIEGAVGCHTLANINGVSYGYVFDLCVSATSNESVDARLELDAVITCHAHATAIKGIPFDDYIFTACISAASELGIEAADKCHQLTLLQDSIPHRDIFGACLGGVRAGIPIDDVVEQISGVDFSIDLNRLSAALRGDDDGNSEQSSSLSGTVTRTATGVVVTFACTGSMEPVITCEHEADAIRITSPDDIGVGDIIVFDSPSDCLGGSIVHRVIAIEVVDDDYSYQTQGDANSIADPCPVPFGAVEYLIENIRLGENNVRKSQLRESVNAAREAHDSARRVLIDAFDETERLGAESSRLADEYNANPTNALFGQWEAAYAAWQTAYSAWEAAKLDYEKARATWECWVEAARVNDLDNRAGCSVV